MRPPGQLGICDVKLIAEVDAGAVERDGVGVGRAIDGIDGVAVPLGEAERASDLITGATELCVMLVCHVDDARGRQDTLSGRLFGGRGRHRRCPDAPRACALARNGLCRA
jgi:hypothetical protein